MFSIKLTRSQKVVYTMWTIAFVLVALLFGYFYSIFFSERDSEIKTGKVFHTNQLINTIKPIDPRISDSLPHYLYKAKSDSIKLLRFKKNGELSGTETYGPFGGVSVKKFLMDNQIHSKAYKKFDESTSPDVYFYLIKGWKLRPKQSLFIDSCYYVQNGVPYYRKEVLVSKTGNLSKSEIKESKLKYYYNSSTKTIMLPVSKNTYNITKYLSFLSMMLFTFFYYLPYLFLIRLLYNIARGRFFVEENIKIMRQASYITIITPLTVIAFMLCNYFILMNYQDGNIVINTEEFKLCFDILIDGCIVFVIYRIFLRGYKIQQENDLVV